MTRSHDHQAMEKLRQLTKDGGWVFDGEVLKLVPSGVEERYGDPADAINYWTEMT